MKKFYIARKVPDMTKEYQDQEEWRKITFARPNPDLLKWMVQFSPIVEIGAGTGYWAKLLREQGAEVSAYDIAPVGGPVANAYKQMTESFGGVELGGTKMVKRHPDATLFLCWPPYNERMAYDALRKYKGNRLIYIGEGWGGCTGDDRFFELLRDQWKYIEPPVDIDSFYGINDGVFMYERN